MRPIKLDLDPANVSLTGYASNVTGASWTIATNNSGDSLAHRVSIRNDSATDHSGKTATMTGTDADGHAQTETLDLPGSSLTVESLKYWLTLDTVVPSATIGADTMDIGWLDEIASKTIALDHYRDEAPMVSINVTGTCSVTLELSNDNPFYLGVTDATKVALDDQLADQNAMLWIDDDTLAAETADVHAKVIDWPMRAARVIFVSYTDTAEAQVRITP